MKGSKTPRPKPAPIEPEPEQGTRISNGPNIYQIGTEIGRGGFAVVFQAFNVETGDFVAVKRFPLKAIEDESLSSIEAEIELMQKLNHPNIVKYVDTIRTKDYLHIVLEYMENGSLSNVIKKFGAFSESLTAIYITQVLRGLKYLHEQGVLHRDIKGANILTTKDGMVKLADFGVAMKLSEAHENDQNVVGSPYWIAPEIIEMSAPTAACDIWSVGCIIIELLTKKPPYYDLPPMAALFRIVQDDYPPLPEGISQALRDFLLLCFRKEPAMRSSATKLLEHPWLHNSSNNPNLEKTTKQLESKAKSPSSNQVEQSNADSIVNTIRLHQQQAVANPPPVHVSLHSQSVDPAALARRNLNRKLGLSAALGLVPRTPTKRSLAPESFEGLRTTSSSDKLGPASKSDSKPPLQVKLGRNATLQSGRGGALLDGLEIDLRKTASLDSHNIRLLKASVGPPPEALGSASESGKTNGSSNLMASHSFASQSKSPDVKAQRSRSGSGSAFSEGSSTTNNNNMQRKDSFLLSDISSKGLSSTDESQESQAGSQQQQSNNNMMYAAGMQRVADSSDEDWDLELKETGIVPASEDSMDRMLELTRQSSAKLGSVGTPRSSKGSPRMGMSNRSLSAMLKVNRGSGSPALPEERGHALHRTHATVTSAAVETVEREESLSPVRRGISRNPGVTLSTSSVNIPNASSLSNGERPPSIILNNASALSLLSKFKEEDEDDFGDMDMEQKSPTTADRVAFAFAGSAVPPSSYAENDEDTINDEDFDDQAQVIDNMNLNMKIRSYSNLGAHDTLSSLRGREFTRSRSMPTSTTSRNSIDKVAFTGSHDEFDSFGDSEEDGSSLDLRGSLGNPFDMADKLRARMQQSVADVFDEEEDEFINYQFDEKDFKQNEHKDVHFRRSREVVDIMAKIRTDTAEGEVIEYCTQLMAIFTNYPEQREHLVTYHGVMPIIDMIEARSYTDAKYSGDHTLSSVSRRRKILRPFVLRVINKIIEGSTRAQEQLSLVGIIPTVMNIFDRSHRADYSQILTPAHHHYSTETPGRRSSGYINSLNAQYHAAAAWQQSVDPVTLEAARFIHQISSTSSLTLQMLIGAGGLSVLTNMVSFGSRITQSINNSILSRGTSPKERFNEDGTISGPDTGGKKTSFLSYSEDKLDDIDEVTSKLDTSSSASVSHDSYGATPLALNNMSSSMDTIDNSLFRGQSNESLLGTFIEFDDASASMHIFQMGIDCIAHVFAVQSSRTRDFCRLFVKLGLLPHLAVAFQNILALYLIRLANGTSALVANSSGNNLHNLHNPVELISPRSRPVSLSRTADLGIASPTNASVPTSVPTSMANSRSSSGTLPSEAVIGLAKPLNLDLPQAVSGIAGKPLLMKHHRKSTSGSTDLGATGSDGASIEESPERKYTQEIATLFFKFSRSDPVVAEMMSNNDYGVITVILTALRAPELRGSDLHGLNSLSSSSTHSWASNSLHSANSLGSASQTHLDQSAGKDRERSVDRSISLSVEEDKDRGISIPGTVTPTLIPSLKLAPLLINPSAETSRRKSLNVSSANIHPTYVEIIELLLKCLKNLSMEPAALSDLEKAGTIEALIPLLAGPISDKCRNHILPCLFNMCRIDRKRQETAAALGVIPHLKKVITDGSPMRQFALPILFDFAHTSVGTRAELWRNDCVSFYLDQLKDHYWQNFALNSLAVWLAHDAATVGKLLVEAPQLSKLIEFFRVFSSQKIQTLHKPLHDMMLKSRDLARALSGSSVYITALIKVLKTNTEAIVLRSLLKMLQTLHHNHQDPARFVADNDLFTLVSNFAQSEGQVLVSQIAEKLLVDFQFTSNIGSSSNDSNSMQTH